MLRRSQRYSAESRATRLGGAAALALGLSVSAAAAETVLHLSDTETVYAQPDELVAIVEAQANAASPQEAQTRVNTAVAAALEQAHRLPDLGISTGFYRVFHIRQPHDTWQASQSITLRTHDGSALLPLVGTLQAQGLTVDQLAWQLSDAQQRKYRDEALHQAIAALRGRAEDAASTLGLRFDSFREVRLEPAPPVMPLPRAMMAAAAAPVGPSAESEDMPVTATADADVVLQPK
jgi:uncharacterized protein YggE